ncbi:MAG: tetratricopeptide repeat protein, partial [Cyanobacteria bacterium P01_C01_bin.118]
DPATSEIVWQSPDLDISPAFKAILARMVRYDFRDRYATATEVLSELATLPAVPIVPLSLENAETEISRPTQVIAPAKPSSHQLSAQSRNQQRPKTKSPRSTVIPTLAVEKLGLPVLSQALPTAPTVAALLSNKPMGRWSMVGLAVLTVGALGLLRNGPTSPPVVTQSVAAPTEPAATPVVKAPSPPPAEAESLPPPAAEQVASPPVQTPPPEIANEAPAAAQPSADVLLAKAQDLRDRNQYNEALQVYDQLTEQTPDKPEAHWGQCYSLNQLQNYNQAVAACDRALAIAPDHIQALLSKGYALEQQGQPQAALELYDQALQVDPDYIDAWNNRGGILFRQQRFQEALTAFDRAREIDPGFAEAWNNRGAALWELRQFDDAVSSIDQALTLQPDYPEAQKLREQIRQKLGR